MKIITIATILISMQALSTTAINNCICDTSLNIDLLEIFYEHSINIEKTINACNNKAMLVKCSNNILAKISGLQESIPKRNVDIVSELYDLRLTLQVELGKVFLLVQELASLNASIIGTVDIIINEISLRLLTLLGVCKIPLEQGVTEEGVLRNIDNAFISLCESLFSLIEYVYNLTYGLSKKSILVNNLEVLLETILLTINGSVTLCKELLVHANISVSSTIINLCMYLEIASNLVKQGKSSISVCLDLCDKLDIEVDLDILEPIFENEVNTTANTINKISSIFVLNRVNIPTIGKLKSNSRILLLAITNLINTFESVKITKSQSYNMLVVIMNVLRSINSLTEYLIKMYTHRANIKSNDSTNRVRIILLDITTNYELLIDSVFRMSVTYFTHVIRTTDLSKANNLTIKLALIDKQLGGVASSLRELAKSALNVIEITLRSSVVIIRTKASKCLTSVNGFTNDIRTMLDNLDETNIYSGIYRLYFGSGPSAIGSLGVCSARFAIILETTDAYSRLLNAAIGKITRQISCSY